MTDEVFIVTAIAVTPRAKHVLTARSAVSIHSKDKTPRDHYHGPHALVIIIIARFIERTYLIETTTQGALQHIITPTDLFLGPS